LGYLNCKFASRDHEIDLWCLSAATTTQKVRIGPRRPATAHTRLLTEFERSVTDFLLKKEAKEAAAAAIRPAFQASAANRRTERAAAAAAVAAEDEDEEEQRESNVDAAATSIIDVSTLKRKKVKYYCYLVQQRNMVRIQNLSYVLLKMAFRGHIYCTLSLYLWYVGAFF
jgi:hypothetical protein